MWPPRQDTTFQSGAYVFGFSMLGFSLFGNARTYSQQAIFGIRPFGGEIPGVNMENEILRFIDGAPVPRATGPWARTPLMTMMAHGAKAKRFVFRVWRGERQVTRYTPYMSSPKNYLAPWAVKLTEAMTRWKALSDSGKAKVDADAKRTRGATMGHTYFVKLYIKDDPRWMKYV